MRGPGIVLVLLALAGCGESDRPPAGSAGASGGGSPRGETLSLACQACHSLERDGPTLIGPNLHGVFGRRAGTAEGFAGYSAALKSSGIVWSPAELDRWLTDPASFLPGTTMGFTGYRDAADREALIDYLVAATGGDGRSD